MADQSISIRLALTDGGKVKAELVDIGASGQKALERIRDAAQPASRGLQALDVAGTAVRGKMQEMAGSAGALGAGLTRLGPGGLAAAAGVGGITVALGLVIGRAREAIDTFDALDDQAARIGTSAESFQELVYAFGQIGVKADATETALTRLNDVIGDVMIQGAKTPPEVARAFDQLGIPANAAGSYLKAGTAATGPSVFSIKKNGTEFLTATVAAAGTTATFASSQTDFAVGDVLKIVAPANADATLADIAITLAATLL